MKRLLTVIAVFFILASALLGCQKKEQPTGKIHSGKVDYQEFTITYLDQEYTIFSRLGPSEEQLKGEWIGSAEPNGEVQAGVKADREKGTYDVYQCLRDETSYNMLGLDFSMLLVFEYNQGGEDEGYCYWMAPEAFNKPEEESVTNFQDYVEEQAKEGSNPAE